MPVMNVRMLPQKDGVKIAEIMKGICGKIADILQVPEHAVWATWEILPPKQFIEGKNEATIQPIGTHPPIVTITMYEGRSPEKIEAILNCIADELTTGLRMEKGNVFITYVEAKKGQIYTGGNIRK